MRNIIELNIEIDTSGKTIYIGEENSSGVEEKYDNFKDLTKYIENYLEIYHRKEIEENGRLITLKKDAEFIYQFLKEQNDTEWIDLEKLKILQDRHYVLPGDTPIDLQKKLDKMLEELWDSLEDVPFYERDGIEYLDDDYLDFQPEITTKEDIWHWFDERYSKGVHHLLYEHEIVNDKEQICYTEISERVPKDKRDKNLFYYEYRSNGGETTIEKKVVVDFSGTLVTNKDILGDKEYIKFQDLFKDSKYNCLDDSNIHDRVMESLGNELDEENEMEE